jgi:hypothetical protein
MLLRYGRLAWRSGQGCFSAKTGPRARRESTEVGCHCPRLGSGEARSCPLSGPSLDLNRAHQAFEALCWWGLPAKIRSLGGTPNYGPRQTAFWSMHTLSLDGCAQHTNHKDRTRDHLYFQIYQRIQVKLVYLDTHLDLQNQYHAM